MGMTKQTNKGASGMQQLQKIVAGAIAVSSAYVLAKN
jgi:hypothetical protein